MINNNKNNFIKPAPVKYPVFLGLAYRYKTPKGNWVFGINYGKMALLLTVAIFLLWVAATFAIYIFFKYHRGYEEMSLPKAALYLFDRQELTVQIGNYQIEKGKELIKQGKFNEGKDYITLGVIRSPNNLEGKTLLAQIFVLFKKQESAIKLLESGLPYASKNIDYIRTYTRLVLNQVDDEKFIRIAQQIIEDKDSSKDVRDYLSMAVSTVYALHGNYIKSKEYIEKSGLDKTTAGILRLSKNEWEQGNKDDAVEIIAKNIHYMKDLDPVYALLVNYYIAMKNYDKARQYASLRMLEKPLEMMPRIDFLRTLIKAGETENAAKELEKLFEENKTNNASTTYIANFVSEIGDVALMKKIYAEAVKNKFPLGPYCLLLLETFITAKDYDAAMKFSEEIYRDKPAWFEQYESIFMCLRAIAYYVSGNIDMSNMIVDELIKKGNVAPKTFISTARRLSDAGADNLAYKLLVLTVEKTPKNQLALTRLVQSEINAGNSSGLDKYILRLLNMRRPSRELTNLIKDNLILDRFLFMNDREKIVSAIDAIYELEKVSGSRLLSDMPLSSEESIMDPVEAIDPK